MSTKQIKILLRSNRLRFAIFTIPVVLLLLFVLVSPVAADPPTRETLPLEPFTIPGVCDFDVDLEPLTNKEKITTFVDREGNVRVSIITGGLKVRLTNADTGNSVDLNISGPLRVVPDYNPPWRQITLGPTLFVFDPGVAPDLPLFALIHGRTESTGELDADGNFIFTFLSVKGRVNDVCTLLADS